jgi:hypothetical protein
MLLRFIVALSMFCIPAVGQEQSININGTELKLGMRRVDVFELLGKRSDVSKLEAEGVNWCVKPKNDRSGDLLISRYLQR